MNLQKLPLQSIKESLLHLSQLYFGRFPTTKEIQVMKQLGNRLSEPYSDLNEHLLRDIHRLSGLQVPYQRIGSFWKYLGYQNENPASDIRGGGLLSLDNLIYLLSTHPQMAKQMLHRQSRDNLTVDLQMEAYPWAAVGINITRYLALEFEIIEPSGRQKTSNYSPKTTWGYVAQADQGFNRLFCVSFFLLNCLWHEMKATYMEFPQVLAAMKSEFSSHLLASSSLSQLERTIFQRINYSYYDPSFGTDYTTLPQSSDLEINPHQQQPPQQQTIDYDLLELGNYQMQSACGTAGSGKGRQPEIGQLSPQLPIPDFLSADFCLDGPHCCYEQADQRGLRRRKNASGQLVSVV
jgi:hypothetical protein